MRRRRGLVAGLTSLALACALLGAGIAAADTLDPLTPVNLRVAGGEDAWHPENEFRVDWDSPAIPAGDLPVAIVYRIRDASGDVVVPETRVARQIAPLDHIHVPGGPGQYTLDLWLEGGDGRRGPQGSVSLRFDNVRPGAVAPSGPSDWIPDGAPVALRIGHPVGPEPPSGIRGYAVSVDRSAAGSPCTAADRCEEDEVDLRGGIGDDALSLGALPEGTSIVHAVAVSGAGLSSPTVGSATLRVDATPPAVVLSGVPSAWASGPVRLTATATDSLSGMNAGGPGGPFTAIAVDDRVPTVAAGGSVSAIVTGNGPHRVAFYGRDAAGNLADEESPARTATVRIDEEPPAVAFSRSQDPAEPERIEASVWDPLSGPDPARGSIALRPAGSRQAFEPLPTSVSRGRLTAHWSSDAFAAGDYEFRAIAYDTAGNSSASNRRTDRARMVLANPLKRQTSLQAGFGGKQMVLRRCWRTGAGRHCRHETVGPYEDRPRSRSVAYGRGTPFSGRLTSVAGAPLAGLPIEVVEAPVVGAPASRTTVTTAADGSFLARLHPGPSRHVEAVFAGSRTLTRAVSGPLRLGTRAGVRLHASAPAARIGGRAVVFSGRVEHLGAELEPGGLAVELQFRVPGLPWTEFRTVQTDPRGRFRYPYSFSDDDSRGVRFEFRAFVPAQDDWPYEAAGSRPVFVTGR